MSLRSTPVSRHLPLLAGLCCLLSVLVFAGMLQGYSHRIHPVAVLGGLTMPHAWVFNTFTFIVPGLLMAWHGWLIRDALDHHGAPAHWIARVGAQLLQVSALAFAAQGVLPLDLSDLENPVSARHAAAWMIWWLAFAVGGVLMAGGLRRRAPWRRLVWATGFVALALPICALVLPQHMAAGLAQRIGLALWFLWGVLVAGEVSRNAASSRGSSRKG
ncbi:DUF998 domain-containing protein [Agrilutibacter solisilvae]|uniref:DUF998 domain-containing protein n=1 Tax=Agrilutibacter solisilvae TaxID=2763317 RepID=A0A975AR03_9GAMM|nr:DUF998 domain-containing protein [Lysobacter solisilvae]QSX77212.1 DUF998 domain-containing protein [Lysobacter solisilvae]